MSDLVSLKREGETLRIVGQLSLATVTDVWRDTRDVFADVDALTIDLSGVTRGDSAGLALLVDWSRLAHQNNKSIKFINLPDKLRAIARVTGVEEFLPS